jgi:hypothetical protein
MHASSVCLKTVSWWCPLAFMSLEAASTSFKWNCLEVSDVGRQIQMSVGAAQAEAAFNRNQNDRHCGTFGTLQATGTVPAILITALTRCTE